MSSKEEGEKGDCLASFFLFLFFCESEEDLRAMMRHFVQECRRKDLKASAGKSKVMVLG